MAKQRAANIRTIQELYTDGITTAGANKRVNFHLLLVTDTGAKEWHYFGSTPAQKPPTTADPVVGQYTYVQFPSTGFADLGSTMNDNLLDLAIEAGKNREGLTSAQSVFTNTFEDQGTSKKVTFFLYSNGTWYYFGIPNTTPRPDPGLPGAIIGVAEVQFPRDFNQLGQNEADRLYDLGIKAGLRREGLE